MTGYRTIRNQRNQQQSPAVGCSVSPHGCVSPPLQGEGVGWVGGRGGGGGGAGRGGAGWGGAGGLGARLGALRVPFKTAAPTAFGAGAVGGNAVASVQLVAT
jgi:hypothetical protein